MKTRDDYNQCLECSAVIVRGVFGWTHLDGTSHMNVTRPLHSVPDKTTKKVSTDDLFRKLTSA